MANGNIEDPTQTGTSGLRGLNTKSGQERQLRDFGLSTTPSEFRINQNENFQLPIQYVGRPEVGESIYDEGITSLTQLDNLNNTRGELQPWYAQIGAGLAKGAVLAGTTFADGILGTLVGLGNAAATGTFSGFWDNPFSNAMQQVNEWSEEVLPNYYTDAERNDPWYENIFSANFIGDKVLKNLGFAVGAYYSGMVGSAGMSRILALEKARQAFKGAVTASGEVLNPRAALQAYKEGSLLLDGVELTDELARNARKLKMAPPILQLTGAFSGALGEARIESIQNTKDWYELHKQQLDDAQSRVAAQEREALLKEFPEFMQLQVSPDGQSIEESLTPEGQAMLQERVEAKFDYESGLRKLSEDRAKMGNIDFILNIPLLTVSDAWQFGKLYAGGYNTAKRGSQILKTVAEDGTVSYSAAKPSIIRNALKIVSKGIAEGPYEEMGQAVAGKLAGYKYASELNDFYGAKIDPDAEEETLDWMQATAKAILQTYGTVEGWEEGFIGGLTGMVGIPGFRNIRTNEGRIQSPIYLQGGIKEDIKEIKERNEKDDAIVSQLNNRVQSPEFLNYYQSAIRHNTYQRQMDEAVDNNDSFEFKNAEHNQLISDVIMFDKANRIQDLYDIIDGVGNINESNVNQVKQLTTNQETGTSVYNTMDDDVVNQIQKQVRDTRDAIDKYRKISQDLQVKIGDYFDEDGLEEMTYYFSNINNLEDRFKSLHTDIKDRLQGVLDASMDKEFISDSDESRVNKLSDLLTYSPVRLINELADSKSAQSYISILDKSLQNDPNKQDIIDEVKDLHRIAERRIDFIDKYDTYLNNPQALQQKQERQRDNIVQETNKQELAKTKDAALLANNLKEFEEALNNEPDLNKREQIIDELEDQGNNIARDYKEVRKYNNEVSKAIDSQPISPQIKDNALELFRTQFANANNLEDIANPNSGFINNPETIYDENLSDDLNMLNFSEAQYSLLSAMNEVNNNKRFKERFPSEYLKPVTKVDNVKGSISESATGDSGTTTVPPINKGPVSTYEPPVGNITPQMVEEENRKSNEDISTQSTLDNSQRGKRKYYRPTIPELHIQASKEGDFRPFNVVVQDREGKDFSTLYNYLRDSGAFDYINEGNLKVGEELGFMIDPEFNDHTIFIIDRRNNQIVGSLDESEYVIDKYEGLSSLVKRIKDEFLQSGKNSKFISTPTTRVSQIMVGKIPYGNQERNMRDIPNVSSESVFGIIRNGVLQTNGKISDDLVIKPMDMSQKEGRMYILIPNAAGKYSPASVRIKHFNSSEYNPEDVTVSSTPLYKKIRKSIEDLAESTTSEDVNNAVKDLARVLYIGDVHIDFVQGSTGNGIRFTKVQRDPNKNEIYDEVDGKRIRREDSKIVFLSEKWSPDMVYRLEDGVVKTQPDAQSTDEIIDKIQDVLMSFNLPLQVNIGMLNSVGYNGMLLSSGVITSNIIDASVKSNWFTTDYFDIQGNLQQAFNPVSVKSEEGRKIQTPVGGTEGAIKGTLVTLNNAVYHVDLTSNTVRDNNGKTIVAFPESIMDMAYIQENYGDAQNGSMMSGGIALLPNGKVLNRNTGQYVNGAASDQFKQKLANRDRTVADSKKVIDHIAENQSKVDKVRTNGEFYYILEDDGEYHEYERVHSVLGNNWIESPKQTKALQDIRVNLSQKVDNVTQFNSYLRDISTYYKVDLSPFESKTSVRDRDTIVTIVRDKLSGTNSLRALEAGTSVDSVIRNMFTSKEMPVRPSNMTEQAFNNLVTSLNDIKSNIEARGETFLTNNIVLFNKYEDGRRIAGEVDILSIDSDGNFKIYDVKTSRYSFYDFIDKRGVKVNYFKNKSGSQVLSQEQYYTKQLSSYKNLFESQYHTPITTLAILPFVLEYTGDNVSGINKEKGILLNYDSSVNIPLDGNVVSPIVDSTNSLLPIFNSTLETREPINNVLPEYNLGDSKVGYFLRDGKLCTGYLSPIGDINGVEVYITKVPISTKGSGNLPEHVVMNDFYAVFPNGNTIRLIQNAQLSYSETEAKNTIRKLLEGNPKRVVDISQEETILYNPSTKPVQIEQPIIPATINQNKSGGAESTVSKEQSIRGNSKYRKPFSLREVDDLSRPIWDKDKELTWLNKVLPQLSENDRLVVTKGLIKVAKTGTVAWGQFDNGIITLSNIAAEGTTYHEAFHVVFQLLTEPKLRDELLEEARETYGELSSTQLEESMAEGFREYMMNKDTQSLGIKIINFFKDLFTKVTNWKSIKPSLIQYYRNINEGYYSDSTYKVPSLQGVISEKSNINSIKDFNNLETDTRQSLENKGWTEDMWNSVSNEEKEQAIRCS